MSHILTAMVVRLIAAAMTLVMTGAPVVMAACQATCAERANDSATAEHHTCHHDPQPSSDVAFQSTAHVCGHADEGPSAIGQSLTSLAAPALANAAFTVAAPANIGAPHGGAEAAHRPPLASPRSAPLRI